MNERLLDLLADEALVGLDPEANAELAQMRGPEVDAFAQELERAAAAIAIAAVADQPLAALPSRLTAKLEAAAGIGASLLPVPTTKASPGVMPRDGRPPAAMTATVQMPERPDWPVGPSGTEPVRRMMVAPAPLPMPLPADPRVVPLAPRRASRLAVASGWLAAAACLALAVGAYYLRPREKVVTVTVPVVVPPEPSAKPAEPTPAQQRESLLAKAGTAKMEWSRTKDPASKAASGDVVWNAAEQRGFMRFKGLTKNDRDAFVYQLWIFDKNRDAKYPVDGGVFDVDDETGDVVVPIQARLPVSEAALFAVTVEKPGGVVVSKRERIVVTAKPTG